MRLVERHDVLATLDGLLRAVDSGVGRIVLVPGEAGVGKTTVVDAWLQRLEGRVRVRRGTCDGSATPAPLAPILQAFPEIAHLGIDLAGRSRLVSRMVECVGVDGPPTVVLIEDGHWADEATVDILRAFAVRSSEIRWLVVITFRSDEVAAEHPLGILVGDWTARPEIATVRISPLTPAAVAALAGEAGTDLDPAELHRRTGGNPFYVTEILASGGDALPASVRDAVRARIARHSQACRSALDVVALAGLQVDPFVLDHVLGDAATAIDEAVRSGALVAVDGAVRFRHDLARRTVADDVPPMRRIALHRAILRALQQNSDRTDPAEVAHHAEAARDYAAALPAAVEAARSSSALGAHREAVSQYERALRVSSPADSGRVELLDALSYELYLTGRIDDAITLRGQALQLHLDRGDPAGVADAHRWLSRLHWFASRGASAEAHARQAITVATSGTNDMVLAMALSNMSQLRMLAGDLAGTQSWAERAIDVARRIGADDVMAHALNNVGAAQVVRGDYDAGMRLLKESLEIALHGNHQEHAARALTNMNVEAVMFRRFADAADLAERGIAFCVERDLDSWRLALEGEQALLALYRGQLVEARDRARHVLSDGRAPTVNRATPLVILGLVNARVGDQDAATVLAEVLVSAEQSGELQRLALVCCALAELAWLQHEDPPPLLRSVYAMALTSGSPWELGELARWMSRAGWSTDAVPRPMAEPFALEVAGRWTDAADSWAQLGCPYDEALALAESGDRELVARALRQLTDLGATATVTRLTSQLVSLGGRVPRPRRAATAAHPAGLTERETDILQLLASGAANAEIATALTISVRTVEHHVSAVLIKLGVDDRHRAAAVARERGWVQ